MIDLEWTLNCVFWTHIESVLTFDSLGPPQGEARRKDVAIAVPTLLSNRSWCDLELCLPRFGKDRDQFS